MADGLNAIVSTLSHDGGVWMRMYVPLLWYRLHGSCFFSECMKPVRNGGRAVEWNGMDAGSSPFSVSLCSRIIKPKYPVCGNYYRRH
jgi:hypothetical protein